jgi:hypothetical protein
MVGGLASNARLVELKAKPVSAGVIFRPDLILILVTVKPNAGKIILL